MTTEEMQAAFSKLPTAPTDAPFHTEKIVAVSLPHPYCITPKHIEHSDGILNEYSIERAEKNGARCGVRGCSLKYKDHETQVTLVVVVPGRPKDLNAVPGLHAYLLSLNDIAKGLGIQGYAFPNRDGQL